MINDIFATSMRGQYTTVRDGRQLEHGEWAYRGYGNAEVSVEADALCDEDGTRYHVRLHSSERQVDEIYIRHHDGPAGDGEFTAVITGRFMNIAIPAHDGGDPVAGSLDLPGEAIFAGPSPVWMIHLLMVDPPPTDRPVQTPVVRFDLTSGQFTGAHYRVHREPARLSIAVLTEQGDLDHNVVVEIGEDGFPHAIRSGTTVTTIVRLPEAS